MEADEDVNESEERDDYDHSSSCRERCDAQWKSDFAMHFQKSYDDEFYEFPLDRSVTWSVGNFTNFCKITVEKVACWEERCHMPRQHTPWTTDVHMCLLRRRQFETALKCLNKTSEGAHNGCNALCRSAAKTYQMGSNEEDYLTDLHISTSNQHQYRALNKQCYFQICQLRCREELTRRICDLEDRHHAIDVLEDYYRHDHLDQLHFLAANSNGASFPLVCRRLLPSRYQVNSSASEDIELAMESLNRSIHDVVVEMTTVPP